MTTATLNRENMTAYIDGLDEKGAERLIARVASKSGKVMEEASLATYAASHRLPNKRMAEIFDKGTATIVLYRRLGKYLVLGGTTDSDVWRTLSGKSKANFSAVSKVIDADDATVEKIDAEVRKHFDPFGKPLVAKPKPVTGDGEVPPLDEALALVKRIDTLAKGFDAEAWATVETAMNSVIGRAVKRLAKVEAEATAEPVAS